MENTKLIIYGPNPKSSFRTGGVAKWMGYLMKIAPKIDFSVKFLFSDLIGLSFLPRPIQQIAAIFLSAIRLFFISKESKTFLHINTSLYPKAIYRDFLVLLIGKCRKFTILLQIHGGRVTNFKNKYVSRALLKYALSKSDQVGVFPGPQYMELSKLGFDKKLSKMNNVIERTEIEVDQRKKVHFLFLGRLTVEKGSLLLLENYLKLCNEGFDINLSIAGDGELLSGLREKAISSNYSHKINIPGFLSGENLNKILQETNVFVLPSYHQEGFPLSFLECAEKGMVCLVTIDSAIPEVFEENKEFISLNLKYSDDLYNKMKAIIIDENKRMSMSRLVQERVRNEFTIENAVEQFNEIYSKF